MNDFLTYRSQFSHYQEPGLVVEAHDCANCGQEFSRKPLRTSRDPEADLCSHKCRLEYEDFLEDLACSL